MSRRQSLLAPGALLALLVACTASTPHGGISSITPQPQPTFQAVIRQTDFQIRYVLDGSSRVGQSVELISNPELVFVRSAPVGASVDRGDLLGRAIVDPAVRKALVAGADTSTIDAAQLAEIEGLQGPVFAPLAGRFEMSDGRPVVRAPGIDAVTGLLPIQYLRYRSLAFSGRASIETTIGERQVPCTAIWIPPFGGGSDVAGPPSQLHCRLPSYVETGEGLPTRITLTSRLERNVAVIPNTYIQYDRATDGYYVNIIDQGQKQKLPITVGPTDGVVRVITSQVPIGATLVGPEGG